MTATEKIEQALDLYIRPHLLSHGGGIAVSSFVQGRLELYFTGCCSSCIAGSKDTASWLERVLREQCTEITEVLVSQQTNPELLEFARKLLGKNEDRC